MKYKELNQRIDDMKGEIIEGIRQSVSIYSVKSNPEPDAPFGKGPKDALENAIEQAEKLGLKAKNIEVKMEIIDTPVCRMAAILDSEGNGILLHQINKK